ncbi:K+-transporting ATPase KdpF subunit [Kineococcus radiotolerans]|uniref:K+-transporting ATPase KdpF subunit n=1 Tax=Kineococcus radiotolerans TaxID=131568 RepID=A0A7W4XWC5_KINRA|nr:potassium-transporting ATPase subunit F [Kineococcus radiotolerans]MBB2900302.1 K+-transporting ATPase KdpF subunit [Kineococcus radiotolerans]
MSAEAAVGLALAVATAGYLLHTLLHPERF